MVWPGCWSSFFRMVRVNLVDRDQRQSQITDPFEQSMQGGLIDDGPGQNGLAVLFLCDGQPFKPVLPLSAKVALDADLVDVWLS